MATTTETEFASYVGPYFAAKCQGVTADRFVIDGFTYSVVFDAVYDGTYPVVVSVGSGTVLATVTDASGAQLTTVTAPTTQVGKVHNHLSTRF
jgi:hypothetical protein